MKTGILYMILSGICFAIINFFVKLLGAGPNQDIVEGMQHYPGHELVLARSVVSFFISFSVIKIKNLPTWGVNKKWLIIRGLSGTIALTIFFYTIEHLPLAVATTIQYLAPIFTLIFAMIILKERVKTLQWVFVAFAFSGIALIAYDKLINTSSKFEEVSLLWIGMGILSAVFSGVAYTSIIKLKTTDSPITIVMYFPLIAIPMMTIMCFWDFTIPRGIEWIFLLIIGVFTQFAQVLLTRAFHMGAPAVIAPIQYIGAIYAFLIGFLLFDETLSIIVDTGIIIVMLSVLINALLKNRRS
ncbi:MAG: DMT family transporter [Crocinitomicaceae bacterium]|nr:DMT family transporter [Crocinitomicaceae bacterium]MDG1659483.1 DMT family transporter [Crocinitomicaceae bacterium]